MGYPIGENWMMGCTLYGDFDLNGYLGDFGHIGDLGYVHDIGDSGGSGDDDYLFRVF
jgi:hypothetical protein